MTGPTQGPWAAPQQVDDLADCYFYQTVELPGLGVQTGEWDLRGRVDDYLGHVPLGGKRVLELGTANGFLCFEMEARGADVVGFDLGVGDDWDLVPFGGATPSQEQRHDLARRLHNAWWFTHARLGSRARAVYASIYRLPDEIGEVDIVTAGSILLHLRDPFLALQHASAHARETVVVTEMLPVFRRRSIPGAFQALRRLSPRLADRALPDLTFLPDASVRAPSDTWWRLSPGLVGRYLEVLGFPNQVVTYHEQIYNEPTRRSIPMYTVVATR